MLSKNTCEGVHFSQILSYYLLCFFWKPFYGRVLHVSMVERGCFSDGGSSFLSWRVPHGGASVLMGEVFFENNCWMEGTTPMHLHYEKPWGGIWSKKQDSQGDRIFFFLLFCRRLFFYCLQRAYETLKQNLVKFKHSSHELRS